MFDITDCGCDFQPGECPRLGGLGVSISTVILIFS